MTHADVRHRVYIPAASRLMVTFDQQKHISADMQTCLGFYSDPGFQDLIWRRRGRAAICRGSAPYYDHLPCGRAMHHSFAAGTRGSGRGRRQMFINGYSSLVPSRT